MRSSESIVAVFNDYYKIIAVSREYAQIESYSIDRWLGVNGLADRRLSWELANRACKISVLSVMTVFMSRMRESRASDAMILSAVAGCCEDSAVFTAMSAIMATGGLVEKGGFHGRDKGQGKV